MAPPTRWKCHLGFASFPRAQEKNQIRKTICGVFPSRACVTLVRPVTDEKKLRDLEQLTEAQLRPAFSSQLKALRAQIFAQAKPKTMQGTLVSGRALVSLLQQYLHAMNTGGIPVILTAWESVLANQAIETVNEASSSIRR